MKMSGVLEILTQQLRGWLIAPIECKSYCDDYEDNNCDDDYDNNDNDDYAICQIDNVKQKRRSP